MDKVNEILAKETLYEADIIFLKQNEHLLSREGRIRIGLPVVEEPVILEKVVEFENEIPKKKGRPSKKLSV